MSIVASRAGLHCTATINMTLMNSCRSNQVTPANLSATRRQRPLLHVSNEPSYINIIIIIIIIVVRCR